jgi:hypothetical protein
MIDFPNNPTVGQQFTAAGVTWTWDGTKWTSNGLNTPYLPLSGGVLSGPLTLVGDPTAALQPASKQYVDGGRLGDNRLINGDMWIDQRNGGVGGTAINTYTCDRWTYAATQTAKGGWQRVSVAATAGITNDIGYPYALGFEASSAYSPLVSDYFVFGQSIEADMISDFAWSTPKAQPITLSFYVNCTLTGTFSGTLRNYASTRSYPFTYSIPVANTWTKIAVIIPGDTAGTWVMSGNAGSLIVSFDLGSGANFRAVAGAWTNGNFLGANGAVNVVATNAATFYVTGVKLEIGSVATPYNRQSLAKSLADCQRYYQTVTTYFSGDVSTGSYYYNSVNFGTTMRATPTVVFTNIGQSNFPASSTLNGVTSGVVQEVRIASAVGPGSIYSALAACSAEL